MLLWFSAAGTLILLLVRLRDSRIRLQERMEKEKVRFQMEVLRSQVNPHFLFNSFNTLIELIEDDKDKAVQHVEHLSDFFREILQVRDKELIPLREELELVDTYFLLEQRRFGDRIDLHMQVMEAALDRMVPPLTVQLLVENALKHNRASEGEPLTVELVADERRLTVSNPDRPREAMAGSTGFGINSIRQRYQALTPEPVIISRENGRFSVTIPLIQNHEDPDRRG
jgi:LytS/YehU family sensor histidine kinase